MKRTIMGFIIASVTLLNIRIGKAQCSISVENTLLCPITIAVTVFDNSCSNTVCYSATGVVIAPGAIYTSPCASCLPGFCTGSGGVVTLLAVNASPVGPISANFSTLSPGPGATIPTQCGGAGAANLFYNTFPAGRFKVD